VIKTNKKIVVLQCKTTIFFVALTGQANLVYRQACTDFQNFAHKKSNSFLNCFFAVRTGLEPATSAVTGRHSNQLNYRTRFYCQALFSNAVQRYCIFSFWQYLLKSFSYFSFTLATNKSLQWNQLFEKATEEKAKKTVIHFYIKSDYQNIQIQRIKILHIKKPKDYFKNPPEGRNRLIQLSLFRLKKYLFSLIQHNSLH
jgi:hypothetical protein